MHEPSPSPRVQFSIKTLLALMTVVCVVITCGIYMGPWALLVVPGGLLAFFLVRTNRWAVVVVGLYGLMLIWLTVPVIYAAFFSEGPDSILDVFVVFSTPPYWIWFDIMLVSQAVLLTVPVASTSRREVRRRSLVWPLIVTGLLIAVLFLGLGWSVYEFATQLEGSELIVHAVSCAAVALWPLWTIVFFVFSRDAEPVLVIKRQCQILLAGSILELLVAVPTHVVARHRDYCCAGFLTFIGLTFGISVMLISFGPGVFFLFMARWKRLHPPQGGPHDSASPFAADSMEVHPTDVPPTDGANRSDVEDSDHS